MLDDKIKMMIGHKSCCGKPSTDQLLAEMAEVLEGLTKMLSYGRLNFCESQEAKMAMAVLEKYRVMTREG